MISAWILGILTLQSSFAAESDFVGGDSLPEVFEAYEEALEKGNKAKAAGGGPEPSAMLSPWGGRGGGGLRVL